MTTGEHDRYSRQVLFPGIGEAGQKKISKASIAVAGCGALGSFQAEILARAGVGSLRLIDRDYVDFSNLQRQFLYDEEDARAERPKAVAAARRLQQINKDVHVEARVSDLTPSNAEELLRGCDVILDGTDNFETRYLINDSSVKWGIPWIYGAAIGSYGIVMPVLPGRGPCLQCVYPEAPAGLQPTCDVNGVLASITATVAAAQAALALKWITGAMPRDVFMQTFDVWSGNNKRVAAGSADPECLACGRLQFRFLDGQRRVPVSLCGRNAVQLHEMARALDLEELARRLRHLGEVRVNEFALRMRLPKYDVTFFPDGRAIVKGTTDIGVARGVYAQLVGN
jgi:molybdopterin-synthase adenylyltransferase